MKEELKEGDEVMAPEGTRFGNAVGILSLIIEEGRAVIDFHDTPAIFEIASLRKP